MAKFSTSNIPRPDAAGGKGARSPGGTGKPAKQSWVVALQNKLVEKSKELNTPIDLGPTGVDGAYGRKTRGAVEVIAKALKIENPLDANGRPTKEFNDKVGLGDGVATPPAPTAPGSPGVSIVEPAEVMTSVPVEGKDFDLGSFVGGLPPDMSGAKKDGKTVLLAPEEAFSRFRMIRTSVVAGGLPVSGEIPKMYGLPNASDYEKARQALYNLYIEIDKNIDKLDVAITAEILRKRKAMNLPEKITIGGQEAYMSEQAYSKLPFAVKQGLANAYKALDIYLQEMVAGDRTNPQSLLAVMKRNTGVAVDSSHPHEKWDEDQARQVGKVLMGAGGWLGERIVPADTAQYYKGPYRDDIIDKEWTNAFKKSSNAIWKIIRGQQ